MRQVCRVICLMKCAMAKTFTGESIWSMGDLIPPIDSNMHTHRFSAMTLEGMIPA